MHDFVSWKPIFNQNYMRERKKVNKNAKEHNHKEIFGSLNNDDGDYYYSKMISPLIISYAVSLSFFNSKAFLFGLWEIKIKMSFFFTPLIF